MNELVKSSPGRFYIGDSPEKPMAEIEYYIDQDGQMVIEHTRVAESERGKGLGLLLVSHAADMARQEKRRIVAHCPYARKILNENVQYSDLLA